MLEVEEAFSSSLSHLTTLLQSLLADLASSLLTSSSHDPSLSPIGDELLRATEDPDSPSNASPLLHRWRQLSTSTPWPVITYTEAIDHLIKSPHPFNFPPTWGAGLQSEHERYLACEIYDSPLFITHYPRALKPFYMLPSHPPSSSSASHFSGEDRETVHNFDLILPSSTTLEVAGGSLREHRLEELVGAMRRKGMDEEALAWYTELRRTGSVPHGGFGVGFDRLLAYLAGVESVRDVVAWPRWAGRCDG
jgi:asparaginyl-tRNA synthetase